MLDRQQLVDLAAAEAAVTTSMRAVRPPLEYLRGLEIVPLAPKPV